MGIIYLASMQISLARYIPANMYKLFNYYVHCPVDEVLG
jgi:hypothetical protein